MLRLLKRSSEIIRERHDFPQLKLVILHYVSDKTINLQKLI